MATRCPACATTFRVTPEQLKAHQGQVRCGHCMAVFDGLRALAPLPGEPDTEEQAAAPAESAAMPMTSQLTEREAGVASPPPAHPEFDIMAQPAEDAAPGAAPPEAAPPEVPPPETHGEEAEREPVLSADPPLPPAPDIPEFGLEPIIARRESGGTDAAPPEGRWRPIVAPPLVLDEEMAPEEEGPSRPRRWPWAVGSVLMLLALAGQGAYVFRSDLSVRVPALKPAFLSLCALAGCSVPLPQEPSLISIEASDLQAIDSQRPGLIALTSTLRNHGNHDVGYPALDLVLTDTREHTLARRIFLPAEYLDRPAEADAGIPAHGEVTVRLKIDTGDLGAAGFRLDLLAAPLD